MIVAGRVSQKMAPVLRTDLRPDDGAQVGHLHGRVRLLGGMFNNYALVQGVDTVVPGRRVRTRVPSGPRDADARDRHPARPDRDRRDPPPPGRHRRRRRACTSTSAPAPRAPSPGRRTRATSTIGGSRCPADAAAATPVGRARAGPPRPSPSCCTARPSPGPAARRCCTPTASGYVELVAALRERRLLDLRRPVRRRLPGLRRPRRTCPPACAPSASRSSPTCSTTTRTGARLRVRVQVPEDDPIAAHRWSRAPRRREPTSARRSTCSASTSRATPT